jgi:hypothetical protein
MMGVKKGRMVDICADASAQYGTLVIGPYIHGARVSVRCVLMIDAGPYVSLCLRAFHDSVL